MRTLRIKHIGGWMLYCLCMLPIVGCGGGGGSSAPPATVTVTPPMASVMVGQQIQLAATTTNAMGTVTWSSSNATSRHGELDRAGDGTLTGPSHDNRDQWRRKRYSGAHDHHGYHISHGNYGATTPAA